MSGSRYLKILIMILMPVVSFAQTECNYFLNANESGLTTGTPAVSGFDSVKLALVDKQINQDIQNGFPGAGLLIIKDGKVIKQTVYGYGLKFDPQSLQPLAKPRLLSCRSLFDLASNTKMYATNYAIMQLVSTGKLNLDNPVANEIVHSLNHPTQPTPYP